MWQLSIGISKLDKYASRESGDTVEVVERLGGGMSVVVADAQGTGPAAKMLSNLVTAKALSLLKDGVRDSAVHQAVHDYLYNYKHGRVSCALSTVSADTPRRLLTIHRNSPVPAYFLSDGRLVSLDEPSDPVGIVEGQLPVSGAVPLEPGVAAIAVTDGITSAGSRFGNRLCLEELLLTWSPERLTPVELARRILSAAHTADRGRPVNDMTVTVVGLEPVTSDDEARTMSVRVPLRRDLLSAKEFNNAAGDDRTLPGN